QHEGHVEAPLAAARLAGKGAGPGRLRRPAGGRTARACGGCGHFFLRLALRELDERRLAVPFFDADRAEERPVRVVVRAPPFFVAPFFFVAAFFFVALLRVPDVLRAATPPRGPALREAAFERRPVLRPPSSPP